MVVSTSIRLSLEHKNMLLRLCARLRVSQRALIESLLKAKMGLLDDANRPGLYATTLEITSANGFQTNRSYMIEVDRTGVLSMSSSPVPISAIVTMTFPEAAQAMLDGSRVTKLEWGDHTLFGTIRNDLLMLRLADGWHTWKVSAGDMRGTDWVIA